MDFIEFVLLVQDWITQYAVQPLLILFIGVFIGKLLEEILRFVFMEFKLQDDAYSIGANIAKWCIYVVTVLVALHSVGVLAIVLWFLAGVVATLVLLRAVLGLKDFFANFFGYHGVKAKYKPGSVLKTSFGEGKVVRVHLIDVHVRMASGEDIFIPHRSMARINKH